MGIRSKIVALETGWKTSFAPEDSKRNSQNMSLMNDERMMARKQSNVNMKKQLSK